MAPLPPAELVTLRPGQPIVFGGNRVTTVPAELAAAFTAGDRLLVVQETGDLLHVPAAEHAAATRGRRRRGGGVRRAGDVQRRADHGVLRRLRGAPRRRRRAGARSAPPTTPTSPPRRPPAARRRGSCCPTGCATTWSPGCGRGATRRLPATPRSPASTTPAGRSPPAGRRSASSASCSRAGPTCSPTPAACCGPATPSSCASARTRSAPPRRSSPRRSPRRSTPPACPDGAVSLVRSPARAAGWALFDDRRLALAVARGSGAAVAQLGAVARQAGTPVSLHGTGGAWLVAGAGRRRGAVRRGGAPLARPQGLQHAQRVLHPGRPPRPRGGVPRRRRRRGRRPGHDRRGCT